MRARSRLAAALLAAAAVAYAVAAWAVVPGFYDGIAPPSPYRWVSPPPSLAVGNQQPLPGHGVDPVLGGSTSPFTTYTQDGQVIVSFLPASFKITSATKGVTIKITPVGSYPAPTGFTPATNVYLVTADAPLAKTALVQLQYSNAVPAPSALYGAPEGGAWKNLGASEVSAVFTISSKSTFLGYFTAGYSKQSKAPTGPTVGGGQLLPIIIAAVILLVLIAGVPLALLRRRGAAEEADEPA